MRLEIDIPEHHYNNIMALDSVCLGRAPYKGIIMYAINAIKQGKVLEQEPTTKNDSSELDKNSKKLEKDFGELDCISRQKALEELKESAEHHANNSREEVLLRRDRDIIRALPSVTPQEPRKGHWIKVTNGRGGHECDVWPRLCTWFSKRERVFERILP